MSAEGIIQMVMSAVGLVADLAPKLAKIRVQLSVGTSNDLVVDLFNHTEKPFLVRRVQVIQLIRWDLPQLVLAAYPLESTLTIAPSDTKPFRVSLEIMRATLPAYQDGGKIMVQARVVDALGRPYWSAEKLLLSLPRQPN